MNKQLLKDTLGWGFILWLIGYALGIVLFFMVPPEILGWVIMPIGIAITLLILFKKIKSQDWMHYVWLAVSWTIIAIVCDYLLLVKLFQPADGYYKLDVYIYYAVTFVLPLLVGWYKKAK
ncbi:MAG: hypothetical protein WCV88_06025 [Patescibacteria group bacterium]|jgi:hypothetical protein